LTDGPTAPPGQDPPPRIGRVLQESTLYLLGNVASRLIGFLAIPFYSRFLTPSQYGLIELVELSTQTIAIALGLQAIGAALARLFHDQPTFEDEQAVVSTSLIATAVLSAAVMIAAVAGAGTLSRMVFHTDEWTTLLQAAFVAMFFSNMVEVVLVYERIRANATFFLHYTLITLMANLALNILFIGVLDAGVWGFVSSKLVTTIVSSLYLALRMRRDVGWHWRSAYVPELVRFGAPLVLSSLSYFAIHFSDRFFLSSAVSLAELGRYALAYRFAILVSALVGDSFAKSWDATLYRYAGRDGWQGQFARIASYFTYLVFTTGLAIALFSPELLRVMVPPEYFPPPLLLPIIIASYLAREIGDFFRSLLLINKRSMRVGQIAFGGAMVNLAANVLLIPMYGIYGAAIATLMTWLIYMAVCWVVANREHALPINPWAYARITLLAIACYALSLGTRADGLLIQAAMDVFWVVLFCVAALRVFLSAEERRGALALAGSVGLWLWARTSAAPRPGWAGPPDLLALACHDPVQGDAAPRLQGITQHLRDGGAGVTVVTSVQDAGPAAAGIECVFVPCAWGCGSGIVPAPRGGRIAAAVLRASDRLVLPHDDGVAWLPHAYAAAVSRLTPGAVLLSMHPPLAGHLTALAIKHRHGVLWIADLRMPVTGDPGRASPRAARLDAAFEAWIMGVADAVLTGAEAAAEDLRRRHPQMGWKVHVVPCDAAPETLSGVIDLIRTP
jgi:O-antigen/teichoic acid export membrane protein